MWVDCRRKFFNIRLIYLYFLLQIPRVIHLVKLKLRKFLESLNLACYFPSIIWKNSQGQEEKQEKCHSYFHLENILLSLLISH
jgi:hypothetical protein